MQEIFDGLYNQSKNKYEFRDLMKYISSEENIKLAYRNIKKNKGSKTAGTDGLTIEYFENMNSEDFIKVIQNKMQNYMPKKVRRVEIPKEGDPTKTRPLGIPCIEDRIIQQCILQVLEPICEAKFHNHSYGFRPNRSTTHAVARLMQLVNLSKLHYVVDVDIKGFFDNVDHAKLKKQLWSMGIHDKNLIRIIGKMLKAEVQGIGIPDKGTPQGGILSPLLSNIVLNELDWWISSQWETFETKHDYTIVKKNGAIDKSKKYRALSKTKMKEINIVRYADDFKIVCSDYKTAQKIFIATKKWLKERLNLEISPEKSMVTNLRKRHTEFLGLKLMVKPKEEKYVVQSRIRDKAVKRIIRNFNAQVKQIKINPVQQEVTKLNSMILGSQNYYKMATNVNLDFQKINFLVRKTIYNRLKTHMTYGSGADATYRKLYPKYMNGNKYTVTGVTIFPIYGCKTKAPLCFNQKISDYTEEGRQLIHDKLGNSFNHLIRHLLENRHLWMSQEYADNRISRMAGQKGKCQITGDLLDIENMACHHKNPRELGGSDKYENLMWIREDLHKLIHATTTETIENLKKHINLNETGLKKVNSLRKLVGNVKI